MSRLLTTVLVLLALVVLYWNLGNGSLRHRDEAYYAERARETLDGWHWFTPQFQGYRDISTPPLMTGLMAIGLKLSPDAELGVRFWPALCGAATVILAAFLLWRVTGSLTAAGLAALMLLTVPHWINRSREALPDSALALGMLAGLFFIMVRGGSLRLQYRRAGIALGLAALCKTPFAGVILLVPIIDALVSRRWSEFRKQELRWWLEAAALFLVVGCGWYLVQGLWGGGLWAGLAKGFSKGVRPQGLNESFPWLYYGKAWWYLAPVNLVLAGLAAALHAWPGKVRSPARMTFITMLLLLVCIHLTGVRHDTMLIMVYPVAACFIALVFQDVVGRIGWKPGIAAALGCVLLAGASGYFFVPKYRRSLDFNPDIKATALKIRALSAPGDLVFLGDSPVAALMFYSERSTHFTWTLSPEELLPMYDRGQGDIWVVQPADRAGKAARNLNILKDFKLRGMVYANDVYAVFHLTRKT